MVVENATILLNETINQTANATTNIPQISYFTNVVWPRILELLSAPVENQQMIWTLAPMLIALVLMQIYFGRNKDEALGWNTAYGNSIALIFISASLLRELYILSGSGSFWVFLSSVSSNLKLYIIVALFLYGLLLSTISFYHWIPEKIAFFLMNGISINVTAYVVIVIANSENIPLDRNTIVAGALIFIVVFTLSKLIRFFVPASAEYRIRYAERKKSILQKNIDALEMKMRGASDLYKAVLRNRIDRKKIAIKKLDDFIKKLK